MCGNCEKFDYVEQAVLTASSSFYGQKVPYDYLGDVLEEAISALRKLDNIKKTLFYGRPLPMANCYNVAGGDCNGVELKVAYQQEPGQHIIHGIIGAATECGELLELLQASIFENKPFDAINLDEETGDIFWYLALLAKAADFTFEESERKNIAKLRMRYGEKFSEYDALNRNLKAERGILELNFKSPGDKCDYGNPFQKVKGL